MAQLAILGGGNMAEALVRGALASGVLAPSDIRISEPIEERRRASSDFIDLDGIVHNGHCAAHARARDGGGTDRFDDAELAIIADKLVLGQQGEQTAGDGPPPPAAPDP